MTSTVPSGFTGKLSMSGAALGPCLLLPGAANAVLKNISSIAATRCKCQNLAAAPFVVVCGFIEFFLSCSLQKFCELPWGGSLSLAAFTCGLNAKDTLRNPRPLRQRSKACVSL